VVNNKKVGAFFSVWIGSRSMLLLLARHNLHAINPATAIKLAGYNRAILWIITINVIKLKVSTQVWLV
jgi:hypothetical protein